VGYHQARRVPGSCSARRHVWARTSCSCLADAAVLLPWFTRALTPPRSRLYPLDCSYVLLGQTPSSNSNGRAPPEIYKAGDAMLVRANMQRIEERSANRKRRSAEEGSHKRATKEPVCFVLLPRSFAPLSKGCQEFRSCNRIFEYLNQRTNRVPPRTRSQARAPQTSLETAVHRVVASSPTLARRYGAAIFLEVGEPFWLAAHTFDGHW